jgi:hypothetical protein
LLFVLSAGHLWKEQCKQVIKHNGGSTSNDGNKVGGPAFTEKKGFKSWDVSKKVVSIWSNLHAKSDPNLLVCRVFFPTTMSRNLLEPVETIGAKVSFSTWDTIILAELPKRAFTCLGSMISIKLESLDGGEKAKVVFVGSDEGSSGLASCPTIVKVSIFFSIVPPVLVSSETYLSLWVDLTPIFRYRSADFMGGLFLPPKRL